MWCCSVVLCLLPLAILFRNGTKRLTGITRIGKVKSNLRSLRAYKAYTKFKERIAESDNPMVQRALDITDATVYGLKRAKNYIFAESPKGKAIRNIEARLPEFNSIAFCDQIRDHIFPVLRNCIIRSDFGTIGGIQLYPTVHMNAPLLP